MRSAPARSPRPRGLSAGPEVPGLRRPQRLEGRLRKLLPKGRELRFDRLAPADLALAMSHVDRRGRGRSTEPGKRSRGAGEARPRTRRNTSPPFLQLGKRRPGAASHGPGPFG